jgi:hypothetical protein
VLEPLQCDNIFDRIVGFDVAPAVAFDRNDDHDALVGDFVDHQKTPRL